MSVQHQQFLDHLHCCLCYRSYTTNDPRMGTAVPGGNIMETVPFWITNCMHVVCQNELRDTPREELDNGSIHTTCPFCHTSADMIRLGVEELPERVQQYFQPMQTSFMDLIKAYEFQFQHMAELIRFFKRQTLKQKDVLEHVRIELSQARAAKTESEELRRENKVLLEQIRTLHSSRQPATPDLMENLDVKPLLDVNLGLKTTSKQNMPNRDTTSTLESFRHQIPRQKTASSSDAFAFHPPALRTEPMHNFNAAQPSMRGEETNKTRSNMYESHAPRKSIEYNSATSSMHVDSASRRTVGPPSKASAFLSKTESRLPKNQNGGGTRALRPASAMQSNRF